MLLLMYISVCRAGIFCILRNTNTYFLVFSYMQFHIKFIPCRECRKYTHLACEPIGREPIPLLIST
jgi:hypothetical protein